jgi:predicted metal-dependent hydrolase
MVTQIQLGDLTVDVIKKDIKNVHLSVYPPTGRVRISAPNRMDMDTIRVFAISKLGWIRQHQRDVRGQDRETPREYLDRESHYVWGRRYLLENHEVSAAPRVELNHNHLHLQIRAGTPPAKKESVMDEWHRALVKQAAPSLISKWEKLMGVRVEKFFVQRMKTKWGSCTPSKCAIRLNSELAKKPLQCLEYIIVHEMTHLLEPTHNRRFITLMDQFLPRWQSCRETLNRLPVRHEHWAY